MNNDQNTKREALIDIFLHIEGGVLADGTRCCKVMKPCRVCGAPTHEGYVETVDDAYHVVICERCPADDSHDYWKPAGHPGHDEYR